jgi:hypothetical protein
VRYREYFQEYSKVGKYIWMKLKRACYILFLLRIMSNIKTAVFSMNTWNWDDTKLSSTNVLKFWILDGGGN